MNIIQAEWDALKTLAARYWDGEPVNAERKTVEQLWAEAESSETGQHHQIISRNLLHLIVAGRKQAM